MLVLGVGILVQPVLKSRLHVDDRGYAACYLVCPFPLIPCKTPRTLLDPGQMCEVALLIKDNLPNSPRLGRKQVHIGLAAC